MSTINKNDQDFLVQKIRTQYTEKENTRLDELTALDRKVKKPANIFGYAFGSISALIMGSGMSLVMTDLAENFGEFIKAYNMFIGIVLGVAGIVLAGIAHPIYNRLVKKEREKIAPQIISLTDELMK